MVPFRDLRIIVFLPPRKILTKNINHHDKETVSKPLTGKKPVIVARWVRPTFVRGYITPYHKLPGAVP
jgi:hypothetical protein